MRIVQILPELNEGGVERGTVELSAELVKGSHESIVISSGGKLVAKLEKDGAKHILLDVSSKNPFTSFSRVIKLRNILKELKPDILHARSRVPAWLAYFANKPLKLPFVTTVHGFNSVSTYSKIMTYGDAVISVSNSIKEYIKEHYSVRDEKIFVIPRGIDLEQFNPLNIDSDFIKDFKKEYGLNGKTVVSSVGRITQLKDYETFIRSISLLKKDVPDIVGLIVGSVHKDKVNYHQKLLSLIEDMNLEDNIIFTGSQSKIAEIYSLSRVIVSSSKKPESFGRSVAEAIAMNRPVVATGHGGVLDIIQKDMNGYFFEVGDEVGLSKKILMAKELKFDGFNYIKENYSLGNMVENTIKVYEKVAK